MQREFGAEFIGTFALVSAVCGAALFSAPSAGLVAVAFAVGLSVLAMAFAVGHISGGHFNPAVTFGLVAAGRFPEQRAVPYVVAQVLGGAAAAAFSISCSTGAPRRQMEQLHGDAPISMAAPTDFRWASVFLIETVLTALFLIVIVGATSKRAPVGLCADRDRPRAHAHPSDRDPGLERVGQPGALHRHRDLWRRRRRWHSLWLFWVAPILGGVIGGFICRWLQDEMPCRQTTSARLLQRNKKGGPRAALFAFG